MDKDSLFKITLGALVILFLLGYTVFQARKVISGPQVEITSPEDGSITSEELLEITGKTKNINSINMNDSPIFIDDEGYFREKLVLSDGYNIIEIEAKDRFGKSINKYLKIVYNPPPDSSLDIGDAQNATSTATSTPE